jgi:hypothetical protein
VRLAATAALVLVLAACGSNGEEASPEEQPLESSPAEATEEEGFTTYGLLRIEHDEVRRPASELYRVFSRERTPEDRLAEAAMEQFGPPREPSEDWKGPDLGIVRPETTRLLLHDIDGDVSGLAAALTTSGAVCYSLLPQGGASCSLPAGNGFDVAAQSQGRSLVLFGLVGDSVTAVDVVVGGETRRAQLGANGFALLTEGTFAELRSVVLHRENRDPETIPLS